MSVEMRLVTERLNASISILGVLIIALFLVAIPFIVSTFWIQIITEALILGLFASSLNLLLGYTGMLSFGQAAFYGAGAYTVTLLAVKLSCPLVLAFPGAAVSAVVIGLVIGFFCIRLHGFYFAILTLGFGQLVWALVWKLRGLTGGEDGITGLTLPFVLQDPRGFYFFALVIVGVCAGLLWALVNSPFGMTLKAIRGNAERTEFIGVNVAKFRLIAFVIAAFFSAIAGILFALFSRGAFPELVSWMRSGDAVMATILGGTGTFLGPFVGAALMVILDQVIGGFTPYWPFFLGTTLLLLVLFLPGGVFGSILRRIESARTGKAGYDSGT